MKEFWKWSTFSEVTTKNQKRCLFWNTVCILFICVDILLLRGIQLTCRHILPGLLQHEHASVAMFDHMVNSNNLLRTFKKYGFENVDLDFIKEQIAGPKDCADQKVSFAAFGDRCEFVLMRFWVKEGPADCIKIDEVAAALKRMKRPKAPDLSGLVAEMMQATGDIGTQWILDLCSVIVKEGCIPEYWKSSVVLPIYKGKGDLMECWSYRGIKLLEHTMKVVESIFEYSIRQQIDTGDMQFGFMKSKGSTGAIFIIKKMREKFRAKGKKQGHSMKLARSFCRTGRLQRGWVKKCME